jgi:crotonobetainyl-CoA:carnitine CoA-transferase CaiB-like acyl-CoA transferase
MALLSRGGPLEGVRVLELTKVWAGPYAGKYLAFLGAEVIKVESNQNLDEMRAYGGTDINHAPYFLSLNPEILSVQLNMKTEKGLDYLKQMIAKSDIVINNLRPGAMERMGLDYEGLKAIKPDIIAVSIKMYGTDGPLGYQTGYAPCFVALGGLTYLVGYENEAPAGMNLRYGDSTVGTNAAFAAVAALMHRERTGEGQFVDVSAVECAASMIGDSLLEYSLTGRIPGPVGNRHADMAPHGCYRCANDDWVSIAVASDEEWRRLCEAMERPDLGDRYATLEDRQRHAAELDALLSAWTAEQDAAALAERLRTAGVGAARSENSEQLIADEHLWERGFFRLVSDNREGARPVVTAPWHMSQAQASISRGAPDLGEHNEYVYCDLLGLSGEELQELIAEGVVD